MPGFAAGLLLWCGDRCDMTKQRRWRVCDLAVRVAGVIGVGARWLAIEPLDMRAGTGAALARVPTCSA